MFEYFCLQGKVVVVFLIYSFTTFEKSLDLNGNVCIFNKEFFFNFVLPFICGFFFISTNNC